MSKCLRVISFILASTQLLVQMVSCAWQEVTLQMKAEWRYVLITCGVLCVMTCGEIQMLLWHVGS